MAFPCLSHQSLFLAFPPFRCLGRVEFFSGTKNFTASLPGRIFSFFAPTKTTKSHPLPDSSHLSVLHSWNFSSLSLFGCSAQHSVVLTSNQGRGDLERRLCKEVVALFFPPFLLILCKLPYYSAPLGCLSVLISSFELKSSMH